MSSLAPSDTATPPEGPADDGPRLGRNLKLAACRIRQVLPQGRALPDDIWRVRHRGILVLLLLHAIGIPMFGVVRGVGLPHSLLDGAIVAMLALGAAWRTGNRTVRASFASLGLLTASGILVHLSGGIIEMHFHFFVMLGVIALYQDWFTYLLAVGFVALHHGAMGALDPDGVYNHAAARAHPWIWAGIHALFVLAASVVSMVAWRLNEKYRAQADRARQQEAVAELSRRSLHAPSFASLADEAVQVLANTLEVEYAVVLELVPELEAFVARAVYGWNQDYLGRVVVSAADAQAGSSLWVHHPPVFTDLPADATLGGELALLNHGIVSGASLVIPGTDGRETPYGVLGVHTSARRVFDSNDLNFLEAIANTLGAALRQKKAQEQLTYQALHDPLTGIANRALFKDRVEHALGRAARGDEGLAVMFLDLDDFKKVNDTVGHPAGDSLLVGVTDRLGQSIRPGDTIARLGGDEFAILLEDIRGPGNLRAVAERINEALREPFVLAGKEMFAQVSIGIATAGRGDGADKVMREADVAMYVAKAQGKGHYQFFEQSMHEAILKRLELEDDLRGAVERHELVVHYQPTVALASGELVGMEALVRWQHPRRGLVSPEDFIPIAEETGLIVTIGRWVLEQACRQVKDWHHRFPHVPTLKLAVNVSPRQFQSPTLVEEVARILKRSGIDPQSLVLEITEGVVMQEVEATIAKLEELKKLGIAIAIDDFGTGYSSLAYLRRFPIDILKIDRSFISAMGRGPEDSALTHAIVKLGQTLGMQMVAEGIEEEGALDKLRSVGCQLGQGYLFSRPLPATAMEVLLANAAKHDMARLYEELEPSLV